MRKVVRRCITVLCSTIIMLFVFGMTALADEVPEGYTGWWEDTYYYKDGEMVTGWQDIEGNRYYFAESGEMVTGWKKIERYWYYLSDDGVMVTGLQLIDGNYYYFSPERYYPGHMETNYEMRTDSMFFYCDNSGVAVHGWLDIIDNRYYFHESGELVTGWQAFGKDYWGYTIWFYFSNEGEMATGLQLINGNYYYFCPDDSGYSDYGRMVHGKVHLDSKYFYFDSNSGASVTGWRNSRDHGMSYDEPDNRYYFKSDGTVFRGFCTIDGKEYYFQYDNCVYYGRPGIFEVDGDYYLTEYDGEIIKSEEGLYVGSEGIEWPGGKTKREFYCYFNSDGRTLKTGWAEIDGNLYYFAPEAFTGEHSFEEQDGVLIPVNRKTDSSVEYYFYEGAVRTGFQKVKDPNWSHPDPRSHYIERLHYFDEYGFPHKKGWFEIDGNWYYSYDNAGTLQIGWKELSGIWYYFDDSGVMQTGWLLDDGKWYYFDEDSGAMKTGWLKDDGKWYYLSNSGAMQTGWLKLDGKWYYLDKNSGAMQTGWLKLDGKWYYLDKNSGAMKTGWLLDDGKWYYLIDSGSMKTGWLKLDGEWYYLDLSSGAMATGQKEIDGETYDFDSDGVCLNP